MKNLQVRVGEDEVGELDRLADDMKLSRSEAARTALREGMRRLRMDRALARYLNLEFTLSRAAQYARVTIHEMSRVASEKGIPFFRYSLEDRPRSSPSGPPPPGPIRFPPGHRTVRRSHGAALRSPVRDRAVIASDTVAAAFIGRNPRVRSPHGSPRKNARPRSGVGRECHRKEGTERAKSPPCLRPLPPNRRASRPPRRARAAHGRRDLLRAPASVVATVAPGQPEPAQRGRGLRRHPGIPLLPTGTARGIPVGNRGLGCHGSQHRGRSGLGTRHGRAARTCADRGGAPGAAALRTWSAAPEVSTTTIGGYAPKIRSCHRSLCPGGLISNPNRMITIVAPLSSRTRSGEFNVAPATLIKFPAESKMYMSTSDVG